MERKVYWRRAVKYMVRLLVLVFLLIVLMVVTGMARTGADGNLADVFLTPKALLLLAIIVLWSLAYPKLGFIRKPLKIDFTINKEQISKIFAENGFVKTDKQHIAEPLKKFASSHPKLTGFTSKYSKGS